MDNVNDSLKVGELWYLTIRPDRSVVFASTNHIRTLVNKAGLKNAQTPIVLDCLHISAADFTAFRGFAVSYNCKIQL